MTTEEIQKIRVDVFLKGIDYGMQIQADKETVTIPKEAFDEIMAFCKKESDKGHCPKCGTPIICDCGRCHNCGTVVKTDVESEDE